MTAPPRAPVPTADELHAILVGQDVQLLIDTAYNLGTALKGADLTTSQIRIFFGAVRQIQSQPHTTYDPVQQLDAQNPQPLSTAQIRLSDAAHRKLMLLIPRLAYQVGREQDRQKSKGLRWLKETLKPAIEMVEYDLNRFDRFVEFFEAILAYHKAAGGKE